MSEAPELESQGLVKDRSEEAVAVADARTRDGPTLTWEILQAKDRGYQVLVVVADVNMAVTRLSGQLGAVIVPATSLSSPTDDVCEQLRRGNMMLGHDEVIPIGEIFAGAGGEDTQLSEDQPLARDLTTLAAIPAYNEAQSIGAVIQQTQPHVDEVLVVDDGSTDDTVDTAEDAGATVIEHEQNRGYGAALQTAFREADRLSAEHLVILDADGQHDPTDIPRLLETQTEKDAEIVIGSRFTDDGETDAPLYRRVGLSVVNGLTNLSMGVISSGSRVRDTQSGFRAYDKTAIQSLAASREVGDQMSASTDILYHAHKEDFDIEEVGTEITYDVESSSHHNPLSHGTTLISNLLNTIERDHPILFLGVPGFLSTFVGLGVGYLAVTNLIRTGTFPLGMAVISVFFVLAGIFSCFTAIILHSLSHHLDL